MLILFIQSQSPPFVFDPKTTRDGKLKGYAVELMDKISKSADFKYTLTIQEQGDRYNTLIEAVEKGVRVDSILKGYNCEQNVFRKWTLQSPI